jgi:CHAD domain-containing protein
MSEDLTCGELARRALADRHQSVRWAVARLPLPSDLEAVHDTRVALRRLREALTGLAPCLTKKDLLLVDRVRLGERELGPLRDSEVRDELLTAVLGPVAVSWDRSDDPLAAAAYGNSLLPGGSELRSGPRGFESEARRGLADRLAAEIATARNLLIEGRGLRRLARLAPPSAGRLGRAAQQPARELALQQLPKLFNTAARPHGSSAQLHRRRIRVRRLRYRLELFAPVLGAGQPAVVEQLRQLQSALGHFHDLAMLVEWMDAASRSQPRQLRPALRRLTVRVELEHQAAEEEADALVRRLDATDWWVAARRATSA